MREWIIDNEISNDNDLIIIENECKEFVKESKKQAWNTYLNPILEIRDDYLNILNKLCDKYKSYFLETNFISYIN